MPTLDDLQTAITTSWGADTSFDATEWSPQNPSRGQCVATALVVQHYFGGDLQKLDTIYQAKPEAHYRNILDDGSIIDFSRSQYPADQQLTITEVNLKGFPSIREKRLAEETTRHRYELLLSRVQKYLGA